MTRLLPFEPNWATPFKVNRDFQTDIFTSRSGKEQRRALRFTPRKSFEFSVMVAGPNLPAFNAFLAANRASAINIADVTRQVITAATMASGDATVALTGAAPAWLGANAPLVVGTPGNGPSRVATAASASGSSLTFSSGITTAFPAGTRITPAAIGYLNASLSVSHLSNGIASFSIRFDVDPASEILITPPGPPVTFAGREVMTARPNWGNPVSSTVEGPFETLDFGQGRIGYYVPIAFGSRSWKVTFLGKTPDEMAAIENVFLRAKGRRGEFYMPTGDMDMVPTASVGASDSSFTVAGQDVMAYATDTVMKAIAFTLYDGSQVYAQVQSMAASGLNTIITLVAPLGVAVPLANVTAVSWMPVWRFSSDSMTSEWITNTVCQTQLSLQTVENLTPES